MYAYPTVPQSVGGTLDSGIQLFKAAFRRCLPIGLVYSAFTLALNALQVWALTTAGRGRAATDLAANLALVALVAAAYGALIAVTHGVATGGPVPRFREALSIGLHKMPRMFLATVLYGVAVAVGLVLLIVPGLYLSIALVLYMPLLVLDDRTAMESLKASRAYVKGHYWRVAAVIGVIGVIVIVVNLALSGALGFALLTSGSDPIAMMLSMAALQAVLNIVVTPLSAAVLLVTFHELRTRKEGSDLATRLESYA